MSKKPFKYLVTMLYVDCSKLTVKDIQKLLRIIERERIYLEKKHLHLLRFDRYNTEKFDKVRNELLHYHQDTTTLINLLKSRSLNIGLSSTSITQISK